MNEWLILGVAFVSLIALLWRQTLTLGRLAGINTRARDRERHDWQNRIERLLERRDSPDALATQRQHSIERAEQARLDARVEESADSPPQKADKPSDDVCPEHEYEN